MDRRPGAQAVRRTRVLGVPVDAVDMRSTLELVREMLSGDRTSVIAAVNPEKVMAAQRHPELLSALENAALVIPDGIGVVAAARFLGKERMERVPGSDLMPEICRLAAVEGFGVFLFGARTEVVQEAASILERRFPGLRIAGTHHGYVDPPDMAGLLATINASGAEILFVGLGSPRQELWMDRYRDSLSVRVCQGVGGTFDAICGNPKRAPRVFRRLYLEWLFRLLTQPRRAHRQLALPRFAAQVLARAARQKLLKD